MKCWRSSALPEPLVSKGVSLAVSFVGILAKRCGGDDRLRLAHAGGPNGAALDGALEAAIEVLAFCLDDSQT